METKNRYRFVIHILVTLVRICVGLVWAAAGPLLPFLMNEYGISRGTVGWFASVAPIAVAVTAIPAGIIGARFSLKKTFAVGAFLQAAGIFAPLCHGYELILLTRILYAIGTAITVPVAAAILADWFTSRELPFVTGITVSFVSLGNSVAFIATVPIATILAWRMSIFAYGAFAFTCAVAWLVFGKDRKRDSTAIPNNRRTAPIKLNLNIKQALTQRSTILLALGVMGAWSLGNAMGAWLPTYYHEVFGMSIAKSSSITAVITICGMIASIAGGTIAMRIGRRKPLLMISGIFMGLFAIIALLFNNPAVIFVAVACFGLAANLQNAPIYTIPMELPNANPRAGTVVFSIMLAAGNFGNFLGPLIVGYMADWTGSYLPGFIICAVLSLALFAAGVLLPETGPASKKVVKAVPVTNE